MKNLLLLIVGLVALTMFSSCSQSGRRASELSTSVQYVVKLNNNAKVLTRLSAPIYEVGDTITISVYGESRLWEVENNGIVVDKEISDRYGKLATGTVSKVISRNNK